MEAMALYLEAAALRQEVQASCIRDKARIMTLWAGHQQEAETRAVEVTQEAVAIREVEVGMPIQTPIHRSGCQHCQQMAA
jgi:hypothetical protein